MSTLAMALDEYLALRRSLGYRLQRAGELLADFVGFLEAEGDDHVSIDAAVRWAMLAPNGESRWRAQRLGVVRCFARYLHALDPAHEVPPRGPIYRGRGRPTPFLFTEADVVALLAAARTLRSPLQAATMEALVGLMAVSGLRVGEVVRLDRTDLDEHGVLVVRNSKGRSRHVPLHATSVEALRSYLHRRDELLPEPPSPALFISTAGTVCAPGTWR